MAVRDSTVLGIFKLKAGLGSQSKVRGSSPSPPAPRGSSFFIFSSGKRDAAEKRALVPFFGVRDAKMNDVSVPFKKKTNYLTSYCFELLTLSIERLI